MPLATLADFQAPAQPTAAPSITSVAPEQSQADFQASVKQAPVAAIQPGVAAPWEFSLGDETPYQKLHRLEPAVLGKATDSKGNPIAQDQQKQAEQEWLDAYQQDVTQNGPAARMDRFVKNIPGNIKPAATSALKGLGDEATGIIEHPFQSLANLPRGLGTGIADVAEGAGQLGAGAMEQLIALHSADKEPTNSAGLPDNARLAAGIALARLKEHSAYQDATSPDEPTPGFGAGRLAGGLAAGSSLVPGAGSVLGTTGDTGEAVAGKLFSGGKALSTLPGRAIMGTGNLVTGGAVKRLISSAVEGLSSKGDTAAGALAKANSFVQDAPELRSAILQRVTTAEQALSDAQMAGKEAEELTPLTKEVEDARKSLSTHNMGEAFYRNLIQAAADKAKPGLLSRVVSGAGKVAGQSTGGALAGTAFEGLAGQAGDPSAGAQGAVGGGLAAPLADLYLNSINRLQRAGSAYFRAQGRVGPINLPENEPMVFPRAKVVSEAADELAGKASQETPKPKVVDADFAHMGPANAEEAKAGTTGTDPYFHLNEEIPGHPKNSTVSASTLRGLGYEVPEVAKGTALPSSESAGPTIKAVAPSDSEAPESIPSGKDIKTLAASTVPVSDVPPGQIKYSTKLPGQHDKINFLKRQSPTEFNPKTHGIPSDRQPEDEDVYGLAGTTSPVDSTNIKGIGYDPAKKLMGVVFGDGKYNVHENVPEELHAQLMAQAQAVAAGDKTASVGKFYNKNLRGNPDYKYVSILTPLHDDSGAPLAAIKAAAEQIAAHNMRQSSLKSALENGYDTPENIAERSAAEQNEHKVKLKGILSGGREGGAIPEKSAPSVQESLPKNTIVYGGKTYQLSDDDFNKYSELKSSHDERVDRIKNSSIEGKSSYLAGESQRHSSAVRAILGQLTPKELAAKNQSAAALRVGREVVWKASSGNPSGGQVAAGPVKGVVSRQPAFGKVKIKLSDGTEISVPSSEVSATSQD